MSGSRGWHVAPLWRDDEEMAKKDDDHRLPRHANRPGAHWQAASRAPRPPRRAWLARILAYLLVLGALLVLVSQVLGLGRGSGARRYAPAMPDDGGPPRYGQQPPPPPYEPRGRAKSRWNLMPGRKKADAGSGGSAQNFNGPIKHVGLMSSLQAISGTGGSFTKNKNVLFAAASLRSASTLLPMACQMALEGENYVHFALMGRGDMPLLELLKINGIDETCTLLLHDARPDHAATSTEQRMVLSVERALSFIHRFMHPQAILVDSTGAEEGYFLRGVRDLSKRTQAALIELPERPETRLSWLTKLDASALTAWNKVRFDIVVQSPSTGTGNLERLLRSVARADLGGHLVPHLVVELPSVVEAPLERFLAGYSWPPPYPGVKQAPSMLSLRHRISRQWLTQEESSVRFLESFWPSDPSHSYVLYLSPHMELSPHFFHYVKYTLLSQLHSRVAVRDENRLSMMAISFSVPATSLGGTQPFTPPGPPRDDKAAAEGTAFLWQAPTSDAVLFLGERWIELHGYVAQVLAKQQKMTASPALLAKKEVGKNRPAWMEYALQLSRLRGYSTLYPSQQTAKAIAAAHDDLPDEPDEFRGQAGAGGKEEKKKEKTEGLEDAGGDVFDVGSQVDMLGTLPGEDGQPQLGDLPLLAWEGQRTSEDEMAKKAAQLAAEFRRQVGQCAEEDVGSGRGADRHAKDLFCEADRTEAQ
ncbi:hypothetical protein CDD83_9123 [Cordyceps sp. RAO-2017]|nr:hypothetical protein CDD83_9123 [Cordyceps sp. RAO-2017]